MTVHSIGNFTDLIEESADFCGGRVYRSGAPRSMKMGTIASLCRYDAAAADAIRPDS